MIEEVNQRCDEEWKLLVEEAKLFGLEITKDNWRRTVIFYTNQGDKVTLGKLAHTGGIRDIYDGNFSRTEFNNISELLPNIIRYEVLMDIKVKFHVNKRELKE